MKVGEFEVVTADGQPVPERTETEMTELRKAAQFGVFRGYNYVAEPAEGFDTHGAWICFAANTRTGYSHVGYGLAWLMAERLHLPLKLIPHRMIDIDAAKFPVDRASDLERYMAGAVGVSELLVVVLPPLEASQMEGLSRATVPYVTHEGIPCSRLVADLCNNDKLFPVVWVKSEFARDAYVAGGVDPSRLRVLHPPIIADEHGPEAWRVDRAGPDLSRPITKKDPFVFGMVGTWHRRKGFHDLVRAYYSAFEASDPVRLVLRTSSIDPNWTIPELERRVIDTVMGIREELHRAHPDRYRSLSSDHYPEIVLTTAELSRGDRDEPTYGVPGDAALIKWLGELDCYANGSYGEGTGIPQVYAAAQGVPMVTSGFGAVGEMVERMIAERLVARPLLERDESDGGSEPAPPRLHEVVPYRMERVPIEMLRVNRIYDLSTEWGRYDTDAFGAAMRRSYERGRRRDTIGSAVPFERHRMRSVEARLRELVLEAAPSILEAT